MAAIAGVIRTSCLRLSSRQIEEMTQYQLQTQLLEFTNQQTWASCCLLRQVCLFVCLVVYLFVFVFAFVFVFVFVWKHPVSQAWQYWVDFLNETSSFFNVQSMPVSRHAEWRVADRTNLVFTNTIVANTNAIAADTNTRRNWNYWMLDSGAVLLYIGGQYSLLAEMAK